MKKNSSYSQYKYIIFYVEVKEISFLINPIKKYCLQNMENFLLFPTHKQERILNE